MKTATLTGPDLNRAVAMSLGLKVWRVDNPAAIYSPDQPAHRWVLSSHDGKPTWMETRGIPDYAGDISWAWPIIKKHKIETQHNGDTWLACGTQPPTAWWPDPDPQVAAMRCFVASVYGDEVELP